MFCFCRRIELSGLLIRLVAVSGTDESDVFDSEDDEEEAAGCGS